MIQDPQTSKEERITQYQSQRETRARKRRRSIRHRRLLILLLAVLLATGVLWLARGCKAQDPTAPEDGAQTLLPPAEDGMIPVGTTQFLAGYQFQSSADTARPGEDLIASASAIVVDAADNTVVAEKDAHNTISPASMTKVLTLLVAAEHLTDLDGTFTITREITDYCFQHSCSAAGFLDGETVPVRDLLYGTILPSGADAALALATYTAGSQEVFVEWMNQKLADLGLADSSHFTNCVGLYDAYHYSTAYDIAVIMKAALENELCRTVLSAHTYNTAGTKQHPEGLLISNWFLRRIEDKDSGGLVVAAKTGFVSQSGNCAVSYCLYPDGTPYIAVTANAYSDWRCIYDHVALYSTYRPASASPEADPAAGTPSAPAQTQPTV